MLTHDSSVSLLGANPTKMGPCHPPKGKSDNVPNYFIHNGPKLETIQMPIKWVSKL